MRVLLLNMPFASLSRPAIGISLLQARLAEEGIECRVGYPNLLFAEQIGLDGYHLIEERLSPALFAGDWLFGQYLFGDRLEQQIYLATLRRQIEKADDFELYVSLRNRIAPFLSACLEQFEVHLYDLIGFTTMFEQNLASLAFAHMIKRAYPEKRIVFGGANCEGVMGLELHRNFPWIDYVCSGESDHSFPELVKRIATNQQIHGIGGTIYRNGTSTLAGPPARVEDIDRLPDPDYTDYFATIDASPHAARLKPVLLFESARGCWWGAKSHCTFCGLNGATMAFRAKSPERVLAELERQRQRYGISRFVAVDNIMSYRYFETLLPELKRRQGGFSLFYEIKANLRREQVELLRDSGVLAIQPGIESLNTHVLRLMRKGLSAIQNVQLLKWCRELGIEVAWNLLFGFPGETPADYEQTARTIEALYHLKPPGVASRIRLDRFSPYFDDSVANGIVRVRPFSLYRFIYPLPPESIANVAYFFEYDYADGRQPETYMGRTLERVGIWKANQSGDLIKRYGESPEMVIEDTRPGRPARHFGFNGIQRELYDYCDEARSRSQIMAFAEQHIGDSEQLQSSVVQFLDQMESWQLMLREGSQYLSLAVPAPDKGSARFVPAQPHAQTVHLGAP